jgi:hypothetical protein
LHPEYAVEIASWLSRSIGAIERPGDAIFVHHWVMAAYFRAFTAAPTHRRAHTGGQHRALEDVMRTFRRAIV